MITRDPAQAWGEYLRGFEWSYFVSLTTGLPSSPAAIKRYFDNRFVRSLARAAQQPLAWFYVGESGGAGRHHAHALVWTGPTLNSSHIRGAWRIGLSHIETYDPNRGAAYYVTKSLGSDPDYDLSRRLPPERNMLCVA